MNLLEQIRFYEHILRMLGTQPGTTKIKLLDWMLGKKLFCVKDVLDDLPEIHRTEVYKSMNYFVKWGLLVEIPQVDINTLSQELLEDLTERGVASRTKALQRLGVNRKKYWLFTPQRAILRLQERIGELKELAGLLRGLP